ncbi:NAD(P)/FAD-dependent oxidoreductase [Corynebacterium sp. YIM 101645]|uniref:NAD(P)/FAD-dependent oxidoreductase n=1 Tax=Corynebacterium lemuris TaxID=1859292 RepID=A0ABT2G058_9CORY|nr:NAD(P)/FAD-dependent oxidoreductase [Corynebacterium lemuris]MCS5480882.1 NAD(P)/FAD-dependent oxidoreductase [Corynebacterium lemuris]
MNRSAHVDVVVVGAGFAGIYATHLLRNKNGLSVQGFERGSDVGGTWFWNRYPGARCDAESIVYSYSFDDDIQQEWTWSERWATQPEILRYAGFVADKLGVRESYAFNTEVASMVWDEEAGLWSTTTSDGETTTSRFVITAVGCLSASQVPEFKGLEDFTGEVYHTGSWPHEGVDLTGKRVAVIGTGSSGIQAIPVIAQQAAHVTVLQRTPNYTVPARNRKLGVDEMSLIKRIYPALREKVRETPAGVIVKPPIGAALELPPEEIRAELDRRWEQGGPTFMNAFTDTMSDHAANQITADYVRERIREIVQDPEKAELIAPQAYPIGTKRICVDTDYYATYNRENVALVDVRSTPIERIGTRGPVVDGHEYEVDVLVMATGFDAITGPLLRLGIQGRDGLSLNEAWAEGGKSYLGLAVAGFPNLFTVTGPGSPSVLTNMLVSIEQHVDWISDMLLDLKREGIERIEASPEAQEEWVAKVNAIAATTLYPETASWYMGANIPGKPRVFMPYAGGLDTYREVCRQVAAAGYEGFLTSDGVDVEAREVLATVPVS